MMFITEKVPQGLRGQLTRWMLQLKPGVFIGTLSRRVGDKLWVLIQEKLKNGRAIWVRTMNNEQRYSITTHGDIKWHISEFEGLQLITKPLSESQKENQKKMIKQKSKSKRSQQKKDLQWDTKGTPEDFIIRTVHFQYIDSQIKTSFSGNSAYWEISPDHIWLKQYKEEIMRFGMHIMDFVGNLPLAIIQELFKTKIVSIDIETTDYIPKAKEGFINIIGIAILDLKNISNTINEKSNFTLELKQVFNMTRKRAKVPQLLELIAPTWKDADVMLVFSKDFDITIINTVIETDGLPITLPKNVIDLQDDFVNLKSLESYLEEKCGVKRTLTEKGKVSEYYQQFKGKGSLGLDKQIEPIGTYNLTDVLTPLLAYLYLNSSSNTLKRKKNQI